MPGPPRAHVRRDAASSSVNPRVIVPSVTVIGVLVLITVVGAVFVIVRAYRSRQRRLHGRRMSDAHQESRAGREERGGGDGVRGGGVMGGSGERWERAERAERGKPFARDWRHSEPALLPSPGLALQRPSSWNPRVKGRPGMGIHIAELDLGPRGGHVPSPSLSKIERITGNALSNDLYAERPSGAPAVPPPARHPSSRRLSFPPPSASVLPREPKFGLKLETDLAQLSPTSTNDTSLHDDISPSSSQGTITISGLSAPPAAAYPNIAALARANAHDKARSQRLSAYAAGSVTEHIAGQFNRTRQSRLSQRVTSTRDMAPPPSAAFGGFPRRQNSKASAVSDLSTMSKISALSDLSTVSSVSAGSDSTVSMGPTAPSSNSLKPPPLPPHRRSWSGRSILLLDNPRPPRPPAPASLPTHPRTPTQTSFQVPPHLTVPTMQLTPPQETARELPREPPESITSSSGLPRVSAFGPPVSLDEARPDSSTMPRGPPSTATSLALSPPIALSQSRRPSAADSLPASMTRTGSNSKNSVVSLSTISSFNTVAAAAPNGLSPGPGARRRESREDNDPEIMSTAATIASSSAPPNGSTAAAATTAPKEGEEKGGESVADDSASTVLTVASSTASGNLTEEELAAEMARIRDRAKRVSMERKAYRRREEAAEVRRAEMERTELERVEELERGYYARRLKTRPSQGSASGSVSGSWSDGGLSSTPGSGLLF